MITRRDLLKRLGAASVAPGFLAAPRRQRREGGNPAITIAGQPAEILITPISALTTRVTVVRAGAPASVAGDGSLELRVRVAGGRDVRDVTFNGAPVVVRL